MIIIAFWNAKPKNNDELVQTHVLSTYMCFSSARLWLAGWLASWLEKTIKNDYYLDRRDALVELACHGFDSVFATIFIQECVQKDPTPDEYQRPMLQQDDMRIKRILRFHGHPTWIHRNPKDAIGIQKNAYQEVFKLHGFFITQRLNITWRFYKNRSIN